MAVCDGVTCPLLAGVREEVCRALADAQRPETTGPLLVTVQEAAAMLAIGKTQVWALIRQGELPSVRIGRGRRVIAVGLATYVEKKLAERVPA